MQCWSICGPYFSFASEGFVYFRDTLRTVMALCTACRLVPQTNAVLASYTMSRNGLSSSIAHNFAKDITTLSATQKLASGQAVKAVYGMKDRTALIELAQAPFTASYHFTSYLFSGTMKATRL